MRAKKTGIIFRILSITILIVNILMFIYGMILTTRNNLIDIILFLVLVSISIITIRIVHDTLEIVENCCRSFLDTDYMKEYSDIKNLLEKGTINKEEANIRRDVILNINNDYGNTINT